MTDELFGFSMESQWDYENGFYITSYVNRLAKTLAHYELYKLIVNIPGHIVECGVFKGASLIRLCTFREILESPFSRKIIGFDAFGKFPSQDDPHDKAFIANFESKAGEGIPVEELKAVFARKGFDNFELVPGDVCTTIPAYLESHPELRIAFLHIDVDVYKPTRAILDNLYERLVPGGLLVLDDYATIVGETRAVDEYFAGKAHKLEKLPISQTPVFIKK